MVTDLERWFDGEQKQGAARVGEWEKAAPRYQAPNPSSRETVELGNGVAFISGTTGLYLTVTTTEGDSSRTLLKPFASIPLSAKEAKGLLEWGLCLDHFECIDVNGYDTVREARPTMERPSFRTFDGLVAILGPSKPVGSDNSRLASWARSTFDIQGRGGVAQLYSFEREGKGLAAMKIPYSSGSDICFVCYTPQR
jgi:hypothetical protein